MSNTQEENDREDAEQAFLDANYPYFKEQALTEHVTERLKSYFLENPEIAKPATAMRKKAEKLFEDRHYEAAYVFAVASIEIYLRTSLLKPLVHGLVHSKTISEAITKSALHQQGLAAHHSLLESVFEHVTGVQLRSITPANNSKSLLSEIESLQKFRNKIIHTGALVTCDEAENAIHIAQTAVVKILLVVLNKIGVLVVKGRFVDAE